MTYLPPSAPQSTAPSWTPGPPTYQSAFGMPPGDPFGYGPPQGGQFGYGAPPPELAPGYPPPPQRGSRRKWLLMSGVAGAAVAVVGAVVGVSLLVHAAGEENDIEALVADFAAAVETGDPTAVVGYLCSEEATVLTKALDVEGGAPVQPPQSDSTAPASQAGATDIVVRGELASAVFTESAEDKGTLYFRKESGQWKVCMAAEKDFQAAP